MPGYEAKLTYEHSLSKDWLQFGMYIYTYISVYSSGKVGT